MKANELRRNNLVYRFEEGVGFGIVKVTSSEIEELECIEEDADLWNDGFYLTEIPLTEEWLLRFGFENESKTIGHFYFSITLGSNEAYINDGDGYEGACVLSKVKYVHQLQNLYFALTGEELTLSE